MLITGRFANSPQSHRDTTLPSLSYKPVEADEEVKFKQVELQNKLLDLFVDVPSSFPHLEWAEGLFGSGEIAAHDFSLQSRSREETGAAARLLKHQPVSGVHRIVLEGAPGQGKSTITQYLAQVHRMHLLGKASHLLRIAKDHQPCTDRVPIRIDIRDYSFWVSGKNPFGAGSASTLPTGTPKALEAFIAAHIRDGAGGLQFSVDDLSDLIRDTHLLIVLDGDLLPVPYFHVVFTMPAEIADIAFHNKAVVYAILFRADAEALRTLSADSRRLGAEIGLIAVLHTWGQNLAQSRSGARRLSLLRRPHAHYRGRVHRMYEPCGEQRASTMGYVMTDRRRTMSKSIAVTARPADAKADARIVLYTNPAMKAHKAAQSARAG